MKKILAVLSIALLSGCVTTSSAVFSGTDTDTRPRMTRGSLARIDFRSPEQRMADNAPFMAVQRTTGSVLDKLPIIGPIIKEILSVINGSIEIMHYETYYNDMNEEG